MKVHELHTLERSYTQSFDHLHARLYSSFFFFFNSFIMELLLISSIAQCIFSVSAIISIAVFITSQHELAELLLALHWPYSSYEYELSASTIFYTVMASITLLEPMLLKLASFFKKSENNREFYFLALTLSLLLSFAWIASFSLFIQGEHTRNI
jgi:hypothetical protein